MLRQFASFFCAFIDVYHNFHSFPCFVKKILWSWKKFCDLVIFDFHRFSNTRSNPWFQVKFCLRQSVILNFRAASGIFKKRHFWCSFTQKYLKITQFWKKDTFLSNITWGSVRLPDADFFWIIPCQSKRVFWEKHVSLKAVQICQRIL